MKNYYLYLIRHGLTQGNLDGKYIGQTDLALCPSGEEDIRKLAKADLYPYVEKVYTSPLKRCVETAQIIYPDIQLSKVDEIAEMDFGQFEGKTQQELEKLPEYTAWLKGGPEACPPDGEKFGDFSLRCISGLDIIFRDMMKKDITRAAMVTHGGVITNLLAGFGLPKGHPADYMCGPGEGFEILLSTFLWQKGPAFEISGRLF
ncbi:MAG: histidine phosphatase family protein [Oscillospiraceae bacterium]|nr:histidine phosphatase family protein [Oscillospiraceae bacterium]